MVIVGTHCDKLKVEERERRKAELNDIITQKYLVGRGPQQLREMGLPKILGVFYVSCPTSGHTEGITKLRMALYDIAFSLYAPGKGVYMCTYTCKGEERVGGRGSGTWEEEHSLCLAYVTSAYNMILHHILQLVWACQRPSYWSSQYQRATLS